MAVWTDRYPSVGQPQYMATERLCDFLLIVRWLWYSNSSQSQHQHCQGTARPWIKILNPEAWGEEVSSHSHGQNLRNKPLVWKEHGTKHCIFMHFLYPTKLTTHPNGVNQCSDKFCSSSAQPISSETRRYHASSKLWYLSKVNNLERFKGIFLSSDILIGILKNVSLSIPAFCKSNLQEICFASSNRGSRYTSGLKANNEASKETFNNNYCTFFQWRYRTPAID